MVNNGLFVYGKIQIREDDTLIYINNRSCGTADYRLVFDHVENPCKWGWYKVGPEELAEW